MQSKDEVPASQEKLSRCLACMVQFPPTIIVLQHNAIKHHDTKQLQKENGARNETRKYLVMHSEYWLDIQPWSYLSASDRARWPFPYQVGPKFRARSNLASLGPLRLRVVLLAPGIEGEVKMSWCPGLEICKSVCLVSLDLLCCCLCLKQLGYNVALPVVECLT